MTFSRPRHSTLLILALTSIGTSAAADPFGDPTAQEAREFGALFTEEGESSAFEGLGILGGDGWLGGLTGDLFLRLDSEREGSDRQEHALAWDSLGSSGRFDAFVGGASQAASAEDLRAPEEGLENSLKAGLGVDLSGGWKVAAEMVAARRSEGLEDSEVGGSALKLRLTGKLGGVRLEAGFDDVAEGFFEVGGKEVDAGRKSHLRVSSECKRWKVDSRFLLEEARSDGEVRAAATTKVTLPGGLDSRLEVKTKDRAGASEDFSSLVALKKSWKHWDVSVEDRRLEKRQEPTEGRLLATSLAAKLSFRPTASFRIIGGSEIESRDDLARVEEARKIFVQPSWQPAGDDLRLTMRLDYGTNERLGKLRGEGFHGKSTLRWKACRDRCGTSLAVDLSWQEFNDAVTQVHASEAMAQLRVKFLLPGFASGG